MLLALLLTVADAGTVTQSMETTTPDGIVAGTATKTPPFGAAVTFQLLDPATRKPKSSVTLSTAFREFPNWARLAEPVVRDGRHLFPAKVGFQTDGMGSKWHDAYFAVVAGKMVKVLDVYSEPYPPSGNTDKRELVVLRVLETTTKGLPDIGETREVTADSKKPSLVRKLWRFDGQRYAAKDIGEPRVTFAEGGWERSSDPEKNEWYRPTQAVDGLPGTFWASDDDNAAMTLDLKAPLKLGALKLTAACTPRPKTLRVRYGAEEDGPELALADTDAAQVLKVPPHAAASKLTLEVTEAYGDGKGGCISELSLEALAPGKR